MVRAHGRFLDDYRRAPIKIVNHLSRQLNLAAVLHLDPPGREQTEQAITRPSLVSCFCSEPPQDVHLAKIRFVMVKLLKGEKELIPAAWDSKSCLRHRK